MFTSHNSWQKSSTFTIWQIHRVIAGIAEAIVALLQNNAAAFTEICKQTH